MSKQNVVCCEKHEAKIEKKIQNYKELTRFQSKRKGNKVIFAEI
jgi:hypothetical protein